MSTEYAYKTLLSSEVVNHRFNKLNIREEQIVNFFKFSLFDLSGLVLPEAY